MAFHPRDSEGGQRFGFFHVVKQLNDENRWECQVALIESCMNKVQISRRELLLGWFQRLSAPHLATSSDWYT